MMSISTFSALFHNTKFSADVALLGENDSMVAPDINGNHPLVRLVSEDFSAS